ncbi:MAG: thioredoxin family protein, partial [Clostridia bacterium]|nr:thioredoxin family protein [Clostridia bacterium]
VLPYAGKIALAKLDTYRNQKTSAAYAVSEIPSVLLFKGGEVLGRLESGFTRADVDALLKTVL